MNLNIKFFIFSLNGFFKSSVKVSFPELTVYRSSTVIVRNQYVSKFLFYGSKLPKKLSQIRLFERVLYVLDSKFNCNTFEGLTSENRSIEIKNVL